MFTAENLRKDRLFFDKKSERRKNKMKRTTLYIFRSTVTGLHSISQTRHVIVYKGRETNLCIYLDFRPLWVFVFSSRGSLKISKKIGSYFLNMTVETWKFLSSNSIFFRKSPDAFDMSNHFFILLKNWMRLQRKQNRKHYKGSSITYESKARWFVFLNRSTKSHLSFAALSNRVSETQLPSTVPELSTVGTTLLRQATYKAHANQWRLSPWNRKCLNIKYLFVRGFWLQ